LWIFITLDFCLCLQDGYYPSSSLFYLVLVTLLIHLSLINAPQTIAVLFLIKKNNQFLSIWKKEICSFYTQRGHFRRLIFLIAESASLVSHDTGSATLVMTLALQYWLWKCNLQSTDLANIQEMLFIQLRVVFMFAGNDYHFLSITIIHISICTGISCRNKFKTALFDWKNSISLKKDLIF
jgi:hypothetical protein